MRVTIDSCGLATLIILSFLLAVLFLGCQQESRPTYTYQQPTYSPIGLVVTTDTVHIPLAPDVYNSTRSLNFFVDRNKGYLSVFDKVSGTVCYYDFSNGEIVNKIKLKNLLPHRNVKKRTTVFAKNMDSLFVITRDRLYRFNRSLQLVDSISFQLQPFIAVAAFRRESPPLFADGKIYLRASMALSTLKERDRKKWRSIYEIDLAKEEARLIYRLPKRYQDSTYGIRFFESNYCINDSNRLVISYAADSNIYETDLGQYNHSYNAKSRLFEGDIPTVSKQEQLEEGGLKNAYLRRNSYGHIYYDPNRRRYLRLAEKALSESELLLGKTSKSRTVIFLNENLQVIGESPVPKGVSLSNLFFDQNGNMYVRVNTKDQGNLHFARITYSGDSAASQLTMHKPLFK